jgi:hypothetical protein
MGLRAMRLAQSSPWYSERGQQERATATATATVRVAARAMVEGASQLGIHVALCSLCSLCSDGGLSDSEGMKHMAVSRNTELHQVEQLEDGRAGQVRQRAFRGVEPITGGVDTAACRLGLTDPTLACRRQCPMLHSLSPLGIAFDQLQDCIPPPPPPSPSRFSAQSSLRHAPCCKYPLSLRRRQAIGPACKQASTQHTSSLVRDGSE